ncbi:hypothetical protein DFP72DRAFT_511607 [Ephemerocybe angulata]|uniref:Uncharacterized protein n=1 Tax=Ephemerocybe angulata TaxID=980116 RepID=A0A8H6HRJ1_9AGAR|nr:hypothetical protein DFP72DRAFT_511607 [Tulosesus angulatus]
MQRQFFNLEMKDPLELGNANRIFSVPQVEEYAHAAKIVARTIWDGCVELTLPGNAEVESGVLSLLESGTGLDIGEADTRSSALIVGEVYQELRRYDVERMQAGSPQSCLDLRFKEAMFSRVISKLDKSLRKMRPGKANPGAVAAEQRMAEAQCIAAFAGDLYATGMLEIKQLNKAVDVVLSVMEHQPDVLQLISVLYWRAMSYNGRIPGIGYWLELESVVERVRKRFPDSHSGIQRGVRGYREEESFDALLQRFMNITEGSPFPYEHREDAGLARMCTDVSASVYLAYHTPDWRSA